MNHQVGMKIRLLCDLHNCVVAFLNDLQRAHNFYSVTNLIVSKFVFLTENKNNQQNEQSKLIVDSSYYCRDLYS